jgi:hypothetical protein
VAKLSLVPLLPVIAGAPNYPLNTPFLLIPLLIATAPPVSNNSSPLYLLRVMNLTRKELWMKPHQLKLVTLGTTVVEADCHGGDVVPYEEVHQFYQECQIYARENGLVLIGNPSVTVGNNEEVLILTNVVEKRNPNPQEILTQEA